MGRPPIGKIAMTGAERTRLYRLKFAAAKPAPISSGATAATKSAALRKELAAAKVRIVELEAANAKLGVGAARVRLREASAKLQELEARVVEAEQAKQHAAAAKPKCETPTAAG